MTQFGNCSLSEKCQYRNSILCTWKNSANSTELDEMPHIVLLAGINMILRHSKQSDLGLFCLSKPFCQVTSVQNFRPSTVVCICKHCYYIDQVDILNMIHC